MKIERYKQDIEKLADKGRKLYFALLLETEPTIAKNMGITEEQRKALPNVRQEYQAWYSEALALVRQLLPDRATDFISYYKPLKPRKELNSSTYTISDLLQGITVTRGSQLVVGFSAAVLPLEQQSLIVESLKKRFESSLVDIRTLVQADLLDSELDTADELNKKGFSRAAGVVAGVVLEGHLAAVAQQYSLPTPKTPTINDLNDLLKKNDVLDVPSWRFIQHLGDLRNLCGHKKTSEPTKENVSELIGGVRKIIKTIF
jgi:hypothetical protein